MPTPAAGDSGEYREFAHHALPEHLCLVFIPSLAALLERAKELNGAPLTENQVLRIRDGSKVLVVHTHAAEAIEESRGYPDIDAANAWQSWLAMAQQTG